MPLILGEMSNPRSRQVVVKKMLELVLITDKAEVRRKRKEKGASTGTRRRRKKKQADESSDDERPVRGEYGELSVRTCLTCRAISVRTCFSTYPHCSDFSSFSIVICNTMHVKTFCCDEQMFVCVIFTVHSRRQDTMLLSSAAPSRSCMHVLNLTLPADRSSSASSQSEPEVLSGEDVTDESDDDSEDPQYVKEIHKFMKRAIKNGA